MEFASGGDLQQMIHSRKQRRRLYDESAVWSMFLQIALALKHLHARNILHRDLKTANVFLTGENNVVKVGDLGVSKYLKAEDALAQTSIGTPYYISPEIWRNKAYNDKSDVWSLGCVLYELLTFRHPYDGHDLKSLANKVLHGRRQPIASHYSKDMHTVLNSLLALDPVKRPSIVELFAMDEIRQRLPLVPTANLTQPTEDGAAPVLQPSPKARNMMGTIRFKRQGRGLAVNLPSPKYLSPVKVPAHLPAATRPTPPDALPRLGGGLPAISESLEKSSPSLDKASLHENGKRIGVLQPSAVLPPQHKAYPSHMGHHPRPPQYAQYGRRPYAAPNAIRRPVVQSVREAKRRLPAPPARKVPGGHRRDVAPKITDRMAQR